MRKFQAMLTGRPDSLTRIRPYPVKLEVPSASTRGRGTPVTAQDSTLDDIAKRLYEEADTGGAPWEEYVRVGSSYLEVWRGLARDAVDAEMEKHADPDYTWGRWYCQCGVRLRFGLDQLADHKADVVRKLSEARRG